MPQKEFEEHLRKLWVQCTFSPEEEKIFLFAYKRFLLPQDMVARADTLLWKRQITAAERLLPLLPEGDKPLIKARLQLAKGNPKKTKCPSDLVKQFGLVPSFAYDIIRVEHKKDEMHYAPALLKNIDFFKDSEHIQLWGKEVQYVARELIREKRFRESYQILARAAFPVSEDVYADAQLLAGWIALQRLKQPKVALKHFSAVEKYAKDHRYQARTLYWKARALERLGLSKEARNAFSRCAVHENTFWGQLALSILGRKMQLSAEKEYVSSPLEDNKDVAVLLQAARFFTLAKEDILAGKFVVYAGRHVKTSDDAIYLLRKAEEVGSYAGIQTYVVCASKQIHALWSATYPILPLQRILNASPAVDEVLALSIIRVESAFSKNILSSSGAMGYMQLMPYTAREVAERHAFSPPSSENILTEEYNILLGTTHLRELLDEFKSYPLAIAAYNAGKAAVNRWITNNGDPRTKEIDIIDWIELISYRETRLYVQKVLMDMQMYAHILRKKGFSFRALLGERAAS
jgi:soluble lytic murein transglycosylase